MYRTPFSQASAIVGGVMLAALVVAYATTGAAMFSPGPLHAGDSTPVALGGVSAHSELTRTCSACHAAPLSAQPMAARCLSCHVDVRDELGDSTTLHGVFSQARACMSCHTEHQGPQGVLTSVSRLGAEHAAFGFSLATHQRLDGGGAFTCASCHAAESFKFETARCESCHADYQPTFTTQHIADWGRDCQSCHDGRDTFSRARFAHDTTGFRLDGAHTTTRCVLCHVDARQVEDFRTANTTCVSCHTADDKHRGSLGTDCASCHSTTTWEGATFDHDVFPLDHGARRPSPCVTCHVDKSDYTKYTCYGCHAHDSVDVAREHRGEVDRANIEDCVDCHVGGREADEGEGDRGRRRGGRRSSAAGMSAAMPAASPLLRRMLSPSPERAIPYAAARALVPYMRFTAADPHHPR